LQAPLEKRTLSNGLQIQVMGVHKVPTVHIELAIRTGSGADPAGKFGLASLTADMIDEGAGSRSALEISDAIDYLGAQLSTTGGVDATFVELHVPVARLADALPVMADVVMRPTFPDAELKRLREERLASLLETQDDPEQSFAGLTQRSEADHRYGAPPPVTMSFCPVVNDECDDARNSTARATSIGEALRPMGVSRAMRR